MSLRSVWRIRRREADTPPLVFREFKLADGEMMSFALTVLTLGVWFLMAQKMPTWNWFMRVKSWFPSPLATLWDAWAGCAFCGGFWIALLLKVLTGLATVPELNPLHPCLAYPLDALATTTLGSLTLHLTGPLNLLLTAARHKQEAEQRKLTQPPQVAAATAAT